MMATVSVLLVVAYFVLQLVFGRRHVVYIGKADAHGCVVEKFLVTKRDILFVKYSYPVYRITSPTHMSHATKADKLQAYRLLVVLSIVSRRTRKPRKNASGRVCWRPAKVFSNKC